MLKTTYNINGTDFTLIASAPQTNEWNTFSFTGDRSKQSEIMSKMSEISKNIQFYQSCEFTEGNNGPDKNRLVFTFIFPHPKFEEILVRLGFTNTDIERAIKESNKTGLEADGVHNKL